MRFDCARLGAYLDCALVVVLCTFSDLVVTVETVERFYFDAQIPWRAQYFGHGGGPDFVANAVNRKLWTCGSWFKSRRKSEAKAAFWYLDVVFGSALAAKHVFLRHHIRDSVNKNLYCVELPQTGTTKRTLTFKCGSKAKLICFGQPESNFIHDS